MDTADRGFPPGEMRVSDVDRDRAITELSEAFQAGRLTVEEFNERSGQALHSRTGQQLTGLLADLPLNRPPAARAASPQERNRRVLAARAGIGASAIGASLLSAVAVFSIVHHTASASVRAVPDRIFPGTIIKAPNMPVRHVVFPGGNVTVVHQGANVAAAMAAAVTAALLVGLIVVLMRVIRANRARPFQGPEAGEAKP